MSPLYCSLGHENIADSRFCRQCGEALNLGGILPFQGVIVGRTLAERYQIVRELGHGGFGRTYLAEDTNRFHEPCVLKEFAPQVQGDRALQKAEELFAREAGTLYKLQHPQIPRFRELFRAEVLGRGRLFLVQDYVEGQTYQAILHQRWMQGQLFNESEVTQLLLQLLPVLSYIHDRGVIHRDISPDNLILRSSDGMPILIDFGGVKQIAAAVASQVNAPVPLPSSSVTKLGKVGYAPIEQMSTGEVFAHSDLYALGMTILVLLTAKEPQALLHDGYRPWQQEVSLSPRLRSVLERMLDPHPRNRFQSAQEVSQALQGAMPVPTYGVTQPPIEHQLSPTPYPATIALSPPNQGNLAQTQTVAPAVNPRKKKGSGLGFLAALMTIVALVAGGWWAGNRWLLPLLPLPQQPSPDKPASNTSQANNPSKPEPQFSKAEQARKEGINKRREALGIDNTFFVSLVNQVFYAKHPELAGRNLSTGKVDEALRADWDAAAIDLLDRLQSISSKARSRLGSYTDADLKNRQASVNQLRLSSRALNDLTDAQFFHLFPEQAAKDFMQTPFGQVWQAVSDDQLTALQSGAALETVQFPEGRFSQQVNGNLKPGQGKAYLAQLTKDQTIRLKLRSNSNALRLSFYPPTSKSPALLDDSSETEWSGKLTESGLYEIVIVSTGNSPVSYELDLAAADDVSSSRE